MGFAEYAQYDGLGLAALVRGKEVSPAELVEAAIERIERHNGTLDAVVHKAYDEARRTARGRLPAGPFTGVPFLIERVRDIGREPEPNELEPNTWAVLLSGRRRTGEEVMRGWRTLRVMCRQIPQRFEAFDLFLTPMRAAALPRIGDLGPEQDASELNRKQARALPFTPPFNLTGQPAISLPLVQTADGLPLGMQFVGRYGDEATLFRLAAQLEQAHPWIGRRPPVWN